MLELLFHFRDGEWFYKLGADHRIKVVIPSDGNSLSTTYVRVWVWGSAGWGELFSLWLSWPEEHAGKGAEEMNEWARDRAIEMTIQFIDG